MRILQVVHDFVPETVAGTEISTYTLATDLARRHGHEVHVFCRGWDLTCEPHRQREETLDGLHVRRIDFGRDSSRDSWQRRDPRVEEALRRTLEEVRPDLVHIQHFLYLSTDVVDIVETYGAPVVVSLRNFWFRCPRGTLLYHDNTLCGRRPGPGCLSCLWPPVDGRLRNILPWGVVNPALAGVYRLLGDSSPLPAPVKPILASLVRWEVEFRTALLRADRLHSPSRFLKDQLVDFGIPADRIAVIPNGVPLGPDAALPKSEATRLRVAMIGTHRAKGLHVLLDALELLPRGQVEVTVYGQVAHGYFDEQMSRASALSVRYGGTFAPKRLPEIFKEVDVLVVPSIWYENNPRVIPEAFATRTPVITSNIGGMAELVRHDVDGLLFEAGSAPSLADKLRLLVEHPAELERLGRGIRAPSTTADCTDAILRLYGDVLETRRRRDRIRPESGLRDSTEAPASIEVSAVVPVHNEAAGLGRCLDSLRRQEGCRVEIVVVDDGSTDDTAVVAARAAAVDPRVRLLRQAQCGAGAARNLGAAHARGEVLVFCDGDMSFPPQYLKHLLAPMAANGAAGAFSKEEFVANWQKRWARCWNFNDGLFGPRRHEPDFPEEHDVFRAVRRTAFLRAGGFGSEGAGDDASLAARLGAKAHAAPGAICYHYNPDTLADVFRSMRWYGRGVRTSGDWRAILRRTLPFSLKHGLAGAIRFREPSFVIFKVVADAGLLVGHLEKRLGRGRIGR